jgi:drug/metabolite transporter (DMT)-like permease
MSNQPAALTTQPRLIDNVPLIIICLLLIDSLHFVFAKMLLPYLPPVTSAFYVLGVATVQLGVFAQLQGSLQWLTFRRNAWLFLTIGFLIATSTAMNYAAVEFVDPGTASLLSKAGILFSLGFSLFWLKEHLNRWQGVGVLLALIGVFVITFQPGDYFRVGSLLVLGSTFLYAIHAALVKRYTEHISLIEFFFFRLLATSSFLFLFTAAGNRLVWPSGQAWLILIIAGTVDVLISRTLYYKSLRLLTMSMHTIVMTLSPVIAVIWSLFLFEAPFTWQQAVGGVGILAGVVMVTLKQTPAPARQIAPAAPPVESSPRPRRSP